MREARTGSLWGPQDTGVCASLGLDCTSSPLQSDMTHCPLFSSGRFTDMGLADGPTRVEHYGFLGLSHRSSSSSGRSSGRSVKKYESEDDDF